MLQQEGNDPVTPTIEVVHSIEIEVKCAIIF